MHLHGATEVCHQQEELSALPTADTGDQQPLIMTLAWVTHMHSLDLCILAIHGFRAFCMLCWITALWYVPLKIVEVYIIFVGNLRGCT